MGSPLTTGKWMADTYKVEGTEEEPRLRYGVDPADADGVEIVCLWWEDGKEYGQQLAVTPWPAPIDFEILGNTMERMRADGESK